MNNKTLGERIAELRREHSMTQENLAEIIGVSAQAISKWENGATMPDILLLPVLADTFSVSIDALFGLQHKTYEKPIPLEETPLAVYDNILTTAWKWNSSAGDIEQYLLNAKANFAANPKTHMGFLSETAGAVYADRDIALSYLPDNGQTFTAASLSAKLGISEEDTKDALEKLCSYTLTAAMNVDIGGGETLRVYQPYAMYKLPLLVYPILTLAGQLADFHESWYGLRG